MLFKASAPGSMMLLGEYAVLQGEYALVTAVNKRMSVTLTPRQDKVINLSSALGEYQTTLSSLEVVAPFQFVLATLKRYQKKLLSGCDIHIQAEFSDQLGLASSAAVTAATLRVMKAWLNISFTEEELILEGRDIIRSVQSIGSGADIAACILGGVVAYRADPFYAKKINFSYPISVLYSGSKTKTIDAIHYVKNKFLMLPNEYDIIMKKISECVEGGIKAVEKKDANELGHFMTRQQAFMKDLGVSTPKMEELLVELATNSAILGAKISGSGLGDCVIGLGGVGEVQMTQEGVRLE